MAANFGGFPARLVEEIEPFCKWKRGEQNDILEVHLPAGCKKEQLKVQINNLCVLTITGDCLGDETKWIRFRKEIKVSKDCKSNEIRAKFSHGILKIIMPNANPPVHTVGLFRNKSETQETPAKPGGCVSRFIMMKQRMGEKTVAEMVVVAAVVVAMLVVGAILGYQYFR